MKAIIILAVITALLAVAGSVIVGIKTFDGTVTENYYEEGIAWDETHRKRESLGWDVTIGSAELRRGENSVMISVNDINGDPLTGSEITLTISRPATSDYDMSFDPVRLREGRFSVPVVFSEYGYWDLGISVSRNGEILPFKERVYVKKDKS